MRSQIKVQTTPSLQTNRPKVRITNVYERQQNPHVRPPVQDKDYTTDVLTTPYA